MTQAAQSMERRRVATLIAAGSALLTLSIATVAVLLAAVV